MNTVIELVGSPSWPVLSIQSFLTGPFSGWVLVSIWSFYPEGWGSTLHPASPGASWEGLMSSAVLRTEKKQPSGKTHVASLLIPSYKGLLPGRGLGPHSLTSTYTGPEGATRAVLRLKINTILNHLRPIKYASSRSCLTHKLIKVIKLIIIKKHVKVTVLIVWKAKELSWQHNHSENQIVIWVQMCSTKRDSKVLITRFL